MATEYIRTNRCRACKGTGMKKCLLCKGTGAKHRTDGLFHSCKRCNGTGKVKCDKCDNGRTYSEVMKKK